MKDGDPETTALDLFLGIPETELRSLQVKAWIDVTLSVYQAIEGHPFQGTLNQECVRLVAFPDSPSGYLH